MRTCFGIVSETSRLNFGMALARRDRVAAGSRSRAQLLLHVQLQVCRRKSHGTFLLNADSAVAPSRFSEVTVGIDIIAKRTSFCRCWLSKTFPLCDGAHKKHNAETGDNVGPLRVFLPDDLVLAPGDRPKKDD